MKHTYKFTFRCSEKGTGDYLDPDITVEAYSLIGAMKVAIWTFEDEYEDRMDCFDIEWEVN